MRHDALAVPRYLSQACWWAAMALVLRVLGGLYPLVTLTVSQGKAP